MMTTDKETGMSMITYIDAADGRLVLKTEKNTIYASTVDDVVDAIMNHGISDSVMAGSAMHFAAEYGFKYDNSAMTLLNTAWDKAVQLGLYSNSRFLEGGNEDGFAMGSV